MAENDIKEPVKDVEKVFDIPIHQWTHDGTKVLLVKQIERNRTTGGMDKEDGTTAPVITWPESGIVECPDWDPKPKCGNGIHAWPWGMFLGEGKDVDATLPFLVLAATPSDVVSIDGGKVKAKSVEVVHNGSLSSAMYFTQSGRIAWIVEDSKKNNDGYTTGDRSSQSSTGERSSQSSTGHRSSQSSTGDQSSQSSTGYRSSQSSTGYQSSQSSNGDQSSQSSTGHQSSQSSTGYRSSQSSTGYQSSQSSNGERSSQSSTGDQSSQSSTGYQSSQSSTGYQSSQSSTGERSSQSSTGHRSSQSSTGDQSSQSSTGYRSSQSSTGHRSSQSSTGDQSSQSSTGYQSSQSSTGDQSVLKNMGELCSSSVTGQCSIVEISNSSVCSVCSEKVGWIVHIGAVLVQRWKDADGSYPFAILDSKVLGLAEGEKVNVEKGKIVG